MLHIIGRTLLLYLAVLVVIRLMGKREIGQLSTFDFVVSVIVAELAAIPMEEMSKPLTEGIIPIVTVVGAEILFSYLALKIAWLRPVIDGRPSVIIANGEMQIAEMRRCRYNLEDLLTQLREQGIADPSSVNYAVLETSGKLSVFLKERYRPVTVEDLKGNPIAGGGQGSADQGSADQNTEDAPILFTPLVMDGDVLHAGLRKIGKNREWLDAELVKAGCGDIGAIFLAGLAPGERLLIWRRHSETGVIG